jgi:hypothetical protein
MPQVAGDHRRHALADLRQHVRRIEHDAIVMRVRVDEARRQRAAPEIMLVKPASDRQRACLADQRDAVARYRELAGGRRLARSIEEEGVAENVIVGVLGRRIVHGRSRG